MTHHQFSDEQLELPPTDVPEAPGLQLNFDWTNIKKEEVVLYVPESSEADGSSRYFSFFLPNNMLTPGPNKQFMPLPFQPSPVYTKKLFELKNVLHIKVAKIMQLSIGEKY